MCGGNIKQFAKDMDECNRRVERSCVCFQRLELDEDVEKNDWWLNEEQKLWK